jgi:hypothetical protein
VTGFTIGYSSRPSRVRIAGADHRYHARQEHCVLASGLTRDEALDLEEDVRHVFQGYPKYDKRNRRHVRSAGGSPRAMPAAKVHVVCLAWADRQSRAQHYARNRRTLRRLSAIGSSAAKVHTWIDDDRGYLGALRSKGSFVVALGKQNVHFHLAECSRVRTTRRASRPNPLTCNGRTKGTGKSLAALYRWAAKHCPKGLTSQKSWHICTCLKSRLHLVRSPTSSMGT